jgi:hypothetical protein
MPIAVSLVHCYQLTYCLIHSRKFCTMRVAYTIYSLRRTYAYLCLTRTTITALWARMPDWKLYYFQITIFWRDNVYGIGGHIGKVRYHVNNILHYPLLVSAYWFFVYKWSRQTFITWAMCGLTYVEVAALCTSRSLQKYLERWHAALYGAGRSVLMLMRESKIRRIELRTVHLYHHLTTHFLYRLTQLFIIKYPVSGLGHYNPSL